jgi:hypothetical protein
MAPYSTNIADGFVNVTKVTDTRVKGTFTLKTQNEAGR